MPGDMPKGYLQGDTVPGSHCAGTTEIVQPIKSVEESIEDNNEMKIWDQTMYL